jgi:hypothetical protein
MLAQGYLLEEKTARSSRALRDPSQRMKLNWGEKRAMRISQNGFSIRYALEFILHFQNGFLLEKIECLRQKSKKSDR